MEDIESKNNIISEDSKEGIGTLTNKMRENPWVLATFVLGVLTLILFVANLGGMTGSVITGNVISEVEASTKFLDFASDQIPDIELVNIERKEGFYLLNYFSDTIGNGEVYLTLDGKNLVSGLIPLEILNTQTTTQTSSDYSSEQLEKLNDFNNCLAEKGFVVYGSNTCPHCMNLVTLLGGYNIAEFVYVECSEQRERCNEEAQTGYVPEVQINGEIYEGARTLEAFAQATGCSVPF